MSYQGTAAEARRKLLADVEETLRSASTQTRGRIFIRITELFLHYAPALDDEAVTLFGEVFLRQTNGVDTDALAEASARIAPQRNAPKRLIHTLSRHGVAEVAGPVLTHAPSLTSSELIAIAGYSTPEHQIAIAKRNRLDEQVTQTLIEIGHPAVMNQLCINPGAKFRLPDFGTMLGRAQADDRARVLMRTPVKVVRLGGTVAGECMLIDISPGGAKLLFEEPTSVPELFAVEFMAAENTQVQVRVVWRRAEMIGLRFTSSLVALWDPQAAQASA